MSNSAPDHAPDPTLNAPGHSEKGGKIILYCAADLLWATKIKETGKALGIECRPARNLEMLEARLADSVIGGVLLDLDAGEIAFMLLGRLRSGMGERTAREHAIPVIVFGPHVEVGKLRAAAEAGASAVLARGALHRGLPQVLTDLVRGGAVASQLTD